MKDKELLELAAKAAGVKGIYHEWSDSRDYKSYGIAPKSAPGRDWWNPLTNKAACLQLEIDLKFDIEFAAGPKLWIVSLDSQNVAIMDADRQRASTMAAAAAAAAAAIGRAMG